MNWRAGGFSVLGAVVGGAVGVLVGRHSAQRLEMDPHNGDHERFAGQSMLVGASIGAIVGASLAGPAHAAAAATPTGTTP